MLVKKVVGKIRTHLIDSNYVESNTERLVKHSRRCLSASLYDFSTRFNRVLKQSQQSLESQEGRKSLYLNRSRMYVGLRSDAEKLRLLLEAIDL